ncbi:unnamed protein product [Gulo gulo]|uniref:Uncharacterized protein n=1 Tax=Gulo gulo TaxID=48420 RepID=A0A9X9Q5J7_GULGU|nr:unnamed protein product [Gulo gulo]
MYAVYSTCVRCCCEHFLCSNSRYPHIHRQGDHPEGLRDLSQVPKKLVAHLASESGGS